MGNEIIIKLLEYIEQSKDFVLSEAPEIFNQIIKYNWLSTILWTCIFGVISSIGLSIILYWIFHEKKDLIPHHPFVYVSFFVTPLFFIGLFCNIDSLIEIKVAPKYYIIKKLIKLKDD